MELTHLDKNGKAVMVDISQKPITERVAVARAVVRMMPETLSLIRDDRIKKGDVFASARIAGIMAAKRTHELIPLCHPIPITSAAVELTAVDPDVVEITATVKTTYATGVEMEALTAASVAALTVYDMCKSVDRGMTIEKIQLVRKSGGKSGDFIRKEDVAIT
ncbi:MAG: cyclic pyranopterin monophosphate synthase MoaC [Anaerolineaceae bacterium]|jgi:cyclic pyranopterin phosphate synthase